MPFTTQDSYFSENGDNSDTAISHYNGDNEYNYNDEYDNDDQDLRNQMFPYSTKSPPSIVPTYMPIDPSSGEDEGENEVRYNEKVVSYGLEYLPLPPHTTYTRLNYETFICCTE